MAPLNARFVDTHDQHDPYSVAGLTAVNRKFYVFGQFTRHLRPGFSLVQIADRHWRRLGDALSRAGIPRRQAKHDRSDQRERPALSGRSHRSIAAWNPRRHELVVVTVTGDQPETVCYAFPGFRVDASGVRQIVTTTHPGPGVPDWKEHASTLHVNCKSQTFRATLHPRSVYTFVVRGLAR